MIPLADEVANTIINHLNSGKSWDRDDGTVQIISQSKHSITLSLFATDANGEITEEECDRVTVQIVGPLSGGCFAATKK